MDLADKPQIKRISILGGEPLAEENIYAIWTLLRNIRSRFGDSKKVWLYTGYTWEELLSYVFEDSIASRIIRLYIVQLCDILVDGRYVDSLKDYKLKWRGSSNQRVIDVAASVKDDWKVHLWTE